MTEDPKDAEISQLRALLEEKRIEIDQLTRRVEELEADLADAKRESDAED